MKGRRSCPLSFLLLLSVTSEAIKSSLAGTERPIHVAMIGGMTMTASGVTAIHPG
jgi:hypothetical protein